MFTSHFTCPRCQCHELARSHRKGVDWLMSLIGLRPARCVICFKRFYLRHSLVKACIRNPPIHAGHCQTYNPARGESGQTGLASSMTQIGPPS